MTAGSVPGGVDKSSLRRGGLAAVINGWLARSLPALPPVVDYHVRKAAIDIGLLNGEFWPGGRAA